MTTRESIALGVICYIASVFTLYTMDRIACWSGFSHRCHYCGSPLEAKR
jgi:hypothetical protein